jgi:hypothetical protein
MAKLEEMKRWKAVESVLNRACSKLPPAGPDVNQEFETQVADFHHYIDHNELELAFDRLCAVAELVECRGGVWRDLERAAEFMKLNDRIPELRRRFRLASIQRQNSHG